MPPIIDLAIGLVFVFLLFSLVVSALNELILSALDKRAAFLEECLAELLADPNKAEDGPLAKLLNHGLVDSLSRDAGNKPGKPAYLPPGVFVSALLDQISLAKVNADRTMADIRAGIEALPNPKLKQSLTAILSEAGQDLASFKAGIEGWFNQGMTRVSGWYKRYAQQWMFWLGLVLAIACNVDAVHIIQALSSDSKLRDSILTQAVNYAKEHGGRPSGNTDGQTNTNSPATGLQSKDASGNVAILNRSLETMNATGLPIGWEEAQVLYFTDEEGKLAVSRLVLALFGWLLTALAGTLGAPFWFDTLNRFINIRGNGRAPEEGDPTNPSPKNRPDD